ncbi:MAG: BT0820 family HAD-type phosphatase [Alloprevotella sp.]
MNIAVDFDGTIVEHRYPEIGKELPFATATLRKLIEDGHRLILWSVREGELLDQAVEWCKKRGVVFYAVNRDFDEDTPERNSSYSRKLKVQMFIDDRNVGGLPDWGAIYQIISKRITYEQYLAGQGDEPKKKRRLWPF